MAFVLDASVTLAWCFQDEATPYTEDVLDRLRNAEALVPAIWPLEVANVLLASERQNRLTEADTAHFVELLASLPIVVEEERFIEALGFVLALGRQQGLSAYDASYLELAARRGLPLATQDGRLSLAAKRVGVPLV